MCVEGCGANNHQYCGVTSDRDTLGRPCVNYEWKNQLKKSSFLHRTLRQTENVVFILHFSRYSRLGAQHVSVFGSHRCVI